MTTRRRLRQSASFSPEEVEALLVLHKRLLRGGDVHPWVTCPPVLSLVRKFQSMAERVDDVRVAHACVGRST